MKIKSLEIDFTILGHELKLLIKEQDIEVRLGHAAAGSGALRGQKGSKNS